MHAIELTNLSRSFGGRLAVDNLNLTISQGEIFALLGQNGAGKTTTIRILCGLLPPTGGDAAILGHSVRTDGMAAKQLVNLSPQETAVAPRLTVRENLLFLAQLYGASRTAAREAAEAAMAQFDLTERARDRAGTLSGGLQRRLSLAMALISKPSVLFLDEPTLGLDVRARRSLWKHIEALRGRVTVILTTHYLEEAEALAGRIGILDRGKLRILGTSPEICAAAGTGNLEEAFLKLTEEAEQ